MTFYNYWREQNLHRPKIPKNPKIFRNYQARPWQSSKKSCDSWESWACAWMHESCTLFIGILGNLGPVQVWWAFSIFEVTKLAQAQDSQESRWTKCMIHAQAQESQESQDFKELSGKTLTKFQKILGFLGILGLCMNPALCSSGFLGILGLCRFYEGLMWNYVVYSKKNAFSLCFLMVNLRICADGLHFLVEILKMENKILVLHYWVFF